MKPLKFHPDADAEMMGSAIYYESQQTDLGKRFLSSVQNSLTHIQINPALYPLVHLDVRKCITIDFPYNILFREQEGRIEIMAVMHQHRHPDYWRNR
jgi:plasmid stabilization system protein ParE